MRELDIYTPCLKYYLIIYYESLDKKAPYKVDTIYFSKKSFALNYVESIKHQFKPLFIALYKRSNIFVQKFKELINYSFRND